jgi:ribulose-phosphate 3-epimerase
LQAIRQLNCQPGIVLNPGTPANQVDLCLPLVDLVLVMTVNPGFSGQEFIPMEQKISQIKMMIDTQHLSTLIEVDGGITAKTVPTVVKAGADVIVAATAIFKYPNGIQAGIQALRMAAA